MRQWTALLVAGALALPLPARAAPRGAGVALLGVGAAAALLTGVVFLAAKLSGKVPARGPDGEGDPLRPPTDPLDRDPDARAPRGPVLGVTLRF